MDLPKPLLRHSWSKRRTKPMGLLILAEVKLWSWEDKIPGGRQNRWIVNFARAGNPFQKTKINKKTCEIGQMSTFAVFWWVSLEKAASIFYRNRPVSAFWIHEMRSSEGRIDHPSLGRFPLAGASGSPKMLPIWMISRVGETNLRAISPISRVWDPQMGPFWGKGSLCFLPLARNWPKFDHIWALARLEIRFRDLCGGEKAGYVFWLYFYCF